MRGSSSAEWDDPKSFLLLGWLREHDWSAMVQLGLILGVKARNYREVIAPRSRPMERRGGRIREAQGSDSAQP